MPYYAQFFNTIEHDATYYDRFYKYMNKDTFGKLVKATPDGFQFSVKVPETITREKKLAGDSIVLFDEFLTKISPLKKANKLGAILLQLSPNFTVSDFRSAESFLDKLPRDYDYALEFRHECWQTEGALELLKHYNIASVMTDSPDPKLQYLSEIAITADHAFIRLHGRNKGFWYNYLYSKKELEPWAAKLKEISGKTKVLRAYFNNHPIGQAVINALEFKEIINGELSELEKSVLARARMRIKGKADLQSWLG